MQENKIPAYDEDKQTGVVRHLLIRQAKQEWMLVLVTAMDSFPGRNHFVQSIRKKLPHLTTIVQNINPRKTNVIYEKKNGYYMGRAILLIPYCLYPIKFL